MKYSKSDEQWHCAQSVNAQLNRCVLSLDLNVTTVGAKCNVSKCNDFSFVFV